MNRKVLYGILIAEGCLLILFILLLLALGSGRLSLLQQQTVPTLPAVTEAPPTQPLTEAPTKPAPTEPRETEPQETVYNLTFAGDCTLGTLYDCYNAASCLPAVVGEDYDYPFANVQQWFGKDDFTMVNLEGPLTDEGSPAEKTFAFRGDPELANILSHGSVECVSLANNHSEDYGSVGYENTQEALDAVGVKYAGDGETLLFETDRGLSIGILAVAFSIDTDYMEECITDLKEDGAEIVIVAFHWGTENSYRYTSTQESYAHDAIDAGASIVFGHHPHVLQPVETYGDGIIYYSMGNFAFGGNSDPRDYDTAVISQQVIREPDGTVHLGQCTKIPCSISSTDYPNNYQPTPAQEGSERYERVMEKLNGTFSGPDLIVRYDEEEEATEAPTEASSEASSEEATESPATDSAQAESTEAP